MTGLSRQQTAESEEEQDALEGAPQEVETCRRDADPEVPRGLVHDRFVLDTWGTFEGLAAVGADAVSAD